MEFNAYGKINLSLDVTGILDNGYHSVSMVMQSVELCNIVNIKKALSININYTDAWIDLARIMVDRGNLAVAKNCLSAVNCIEGNANFRYYYYQNILDKKEDEILRTRREFQE